MQRVTDIFIHAMNLHFISGDLAASSVIPPMVDPSEERLPPIPTAKEQEVIIDTIEKRLQDDERERQRWQEECPRAMHKLCAAFTAFINQVSHTILIGDNRATIGVCCSAANLIRLCCG